MLQLVCSLLHYLPISLLQRAGQLRWPTRHCLSTVIRSLVDCVPRRNQKTRLARCMLICASYRRIPNLKHSLVKSPNSEESIARATSTKTTPASPSASRPGSGRPPTSSAAHYSSDPIAAQARPELKQPLTA